MRDELFKQNYCGRFEFNEAVATVFDDMITRSIPFYNEMLSISIDLIQQFCPKNELIYDFGCSTANTLLAIDRASHGQYSLIGIDTSEHMLQRAQLKANAYGANIEFINSDILNIDTTAAGCVISNFTMQFIPPEKRELGFKKAFNSIKDGGIFIFAEKLKSQNEPLEEFLTKRYYDFKRAQNYSELEIMQKRSALENVLIPFSEEQNIQIAKDAGFRHVEAVFRVLNFALFIAFK